MQISKYHRLPLGSPLLASHPSLDPVPPQHSHKKVLPETQLSDIAPLLASFSIVKAILNTRTFSFPLLWPRPLHSGQPLAWHLVRSQDAILQQLCLASGPLLMLFCLPGLSRSASLDWFCPFVISSRAGSVPPRPSPQHPTALALPLFWLCHLLLCFPLKLLKHKTSVWSSRTLSLSLRQCMTQGRHLPMWSDGPADGPSNMMLCNELPYPQPHVEPLTPKIMVFGVGACGT